MFPIRCAIGKVAIVLLVGFLTASCERLQPLYQVENHHIPKLSTPLTLKQIETRILKAGESRNWRMQPTEPGKMLGLIEWRRHSATVNIEYDQSSFSIRYKTSYNLLAGKQADDDELYGGKFVIHRNYNKRIRALERAIDIELSFP